MRKQICTVLLGLSIVGMMSACQQEQKPSDQTPVTSNATAPAPTSAEATPADQSNNQPTTQTVQICLRMDIFPFN